MQILDFIDAHPTYRLLRDGQRALISAKVTIMGATMLGATSWHSARLSILRHLA